MIVVLLCHCQNALPGISNVKLDGDSFCKIWASYLKITNLHLVVCVNK